MQQSQSLQQTLGLSQSQQLRQSQRLKESIQKIERKIFGPDWPDHAVLHDILTKCLEGIDDHELKELVEIFLNMPDKNNNFKDSLLKESYLVSMPTEWNIKKFSDGCFFKSLLLIDDQIKTGDKIDIQKAFSTTSVLVAEIESLEWVFENLKEQWSDLTSYFSELSKKKYILSLSENEGLRTMNENSFYLTKVILSYNKGEVIEFLRTKIIMDNMITVCSERFINRYLSALSRKTITKSNLEIAILNILAEFILLNLWIVHPDMFKLQKFELGSNTLHDMAMACDSSAEQILQTFTYYNLRWYDGKPIFFNRRYMNNAKTSKETDTFVRKFIIEDIRKEKWELLKMFGYDEFIGEIITTKQDRSLEKWEKNEELTDIFFDRLSDEDFQTQLVSLLKKSSFYNLFYSHFQS